MSGRTGGTCAIAGCVLLGVGTYLHPLEADPNQAAAAFAEYARDGWWVGSHLAQLAGVSLITAALLRLAQSLEAGRAAGWARLGAGGAIAGLSVAAALQAVDGIALKAMVDAWATAPEAAKDAVFHAAFAVRQVEIGLASVLSLVLGLTVTAYGVALLVDGTYPRWLGGLAIGGGAPTTAAGIVMAHTGFSRLAMAVSMGASSLVLVWVFALGVCMWGGRRAGPEGAAA
jgi:hypothetical protein